MGGLIMGVMKIAGKNPSNNVEAVAVSSSGSVITEKKWRNEPVQIYSGTPTGTSRISCTQITGGNAGAFSLRVSNNTDKAMNIGLYADYLDSDYQMRNAAGNIILFSVPANKTLMMITPDDIPQLQWVNALKVYIVFPEAPTNSGTVTIYAVAKG